MLRSPASLGEARPPAAEAAPGALSAAAPAAPAAAAPAPATMVTVPAGTSLLVRMVEGISSRDKAGKRFTTELESDLKANNVTVAQAGTRAWKIQRRLLAIADQVV